MQIEGYDPARPFVVVREWPGGRKLARLFPTEDEARNRAIKDARHACMGMTIHLACSGSPNEPPRVIQQWKGGYCPHCGNPDECHCP